MTNQNDDPNLSRLFTKHRAELTHPMPTQLKSEILNQARRQSSARPSMFSWLSFGGGAVAMVTALIMAFEFGKISVGGPENLALTHEVVSSHVRSLMATHLSDVISTDQHTVKPWFEGKIDFAPTVQDYAKDGFPLIGGRLDYVEGRPTAALIYKSNQHVINLLEHPSPSPKNSRPRLQTIRGYQVFSWTKDGMNYWLVSDLNAADLQRLAEIMTR